MQNTFALLSSLPGEPFCWVEATTQTPHLRSLKVATPVDYWMAPPQLPPSPQAAVHLVTLETAAPLSISSSESQLAMTIIIEPWKPVSFEAADSFCPLHLNPNKVMFL